MPCSDDRQTTADYVARDYQKRLDRLTRILCEVGKHADTNHLGMPKAFLDWWDEHKKLDREREAHILRERKRARLRRVARNKLTSAERRALGIK